MSVKNSTLSPESGFELPGTFPEPSGLLGRCELEILVTLSTDGKTDTFSWVGNEVFAPSVDWAES